MKGDSLFGIDHQRLRKLAALGLELDESGRHDKGEATISTDLFVETSGDWVGHYRLIRVLGEGGMGIVYLAQQHRPIRRQVALKLVKPGMDSQKIIARFEAEQQALACMDHPHVAHVYDAGLTAGGRPYFVMEYVEGVPITEHCDKHKLTVEKRLELFLQVCEAIAHAHQKGIIHRDIKPSNILVSSKENQTVTKVIDFGIAKALTQGLAQSLTERTLFTEHGQFVGTPEYMSPEQAEPTAQGIDTRTDIYSLGVVLYELLAGVLPFDTETFREGGPEHIRRVICEADPKTPSTRLNRASGDTSAKAASLRCTDTRTLNRMLHGDIDWITLKAMDKDPDRRYATAHALAEDIRRHLRHEPITAGRPGMVYRLKKFVRRNRTAVIVCGGSLALLLLGLLCVNLYRINRAGESRLAREKHNLAVQQAQADLAAAETAYTQGRHAQALTLVETSLQAVSGQLNGQLLKAQILRDLNRSDEALALLNQLETSFPEEGTVYELLAMLYADRRDEVRVTQYRELAEKYPARTAEAFIIKALVADNLDQMSRFLSEALDLDRQHYQARKMRAMALMALADYEGAERDTDKMIFVQPENPLGYALRALALRKLGLYQDAIKQHDRAIELAGESHPDMVSFYDQRRETHFCAGQYEEALADAQACNDRHPDDIQCRLGLFGALMGLGRYDEADQQLNTRWGEVSTWVSCWLAKYMTQCREAGRTLMSPSLHQDRTLWRLVRNIGSRQAELRSKSHRLVSYAAAVDYSPDGTQLVYAKFNPDTLWGQQTALALPDSPGSKGIEILEDRKTGRVRSLVSFGHFPRWSPDGKHIAFVKSPYAFREPWKEQVYVVSVSGENPRHVCKGVLLGWSGDSRHLYTYHAEDQFVYKRVFDDPSATPERIIYSPSYFPAISPDETCIAYENRGHIIIKTLDTFDTLTTWRLPIVPLYLKALWRLPRPPNYEPIPIEWSPTGKEISFGSECANFGLWIYNLQTDTAVSVVPGAVLSGRWSRDGSKMAIAVGTPDWDIWEARMDPNRPTIESLGPGLTLKARCRQMLNDMEDELVMAPKSLHAWYRGRIRAFCSAGVGDPNGVLVGLDEWIKSLPQDRVAPESAYWQTGASLLERYDAQAEDRLSVLTLAKKMAELAPSPWSGQIFLGMAHYRLGEYEQALAVLNQAEDQRVAGQGIRHPEQVAYTAMTLHQLGNQPEAIETLQELRSLYQARCLPDAFHTLVTAEKVFVEGHANLTALWDRIEEGNLNQALTLLTQIRNMPGTFAVETTGAAPCAARQLAILFSWRASWYEKREEYAWGLSDYESAVRAAPQDAVMLKALSEFKQQRHDANPDEGPSAPQ
jgi:serine/threonine protein kinase/tetratricopeptide (TPR) repeat protein